MGTPVVLGVETEDRGTEREREEEEEEEERERHETRH